MSGLVKTAAANQRVTVLAQTTVGSGSSSALPAFPSGYIPSAGVLVQASISNSGTVYVGDSDVSSSKCIAELAAGASVFLPVTDPTKIFVIGSASSQKVNAGGV